MTDPKEEKKEKTKEEKKKNKKPLLILVVVTLIIVGIVVWQIFFTPARDGYVDPTYKETPDVNFVFLDSYIFSELTPFRKGDDPLLIWDEDKVDNPFEVPRTPEEDDVLIWWQTFNFEFKADESGWILTSPDELIEDLRTDIEEDEIREMLTNPDLLLVEDRWYDINIVNETDESLPFEIRNDDNELVEDYSIEVNAEEEKNIGFQADSEMTYYISGENDDFRGDIRFIDRENQEE